MDGQVVGQGDWQWAVDCQPLLFQRLAVSLSGRERYGLPGAEKDPPTMHITPLPFQNPRTENLPPCCAWQSKTCPMFTGRMRIVRMR